MITSFPLAILVLAALLFYPASKLVWVLSVRRMERKLERKLNERELVGQKHRAWFISVLLVLPFSYLFNLQLAG